MTCKRAVYILGYADQRLTSQGHKIENAYSAISNQLYTIFSVIFLRISAKLGLYIGITLCINPVNFQVRTPNNKDTVWHNRNWHDIVEIIAQYTLHTFFQRDKKPRHRLSMSQDVRPRTRLMKANKDQRRSTMHNTLHHHTPQYVILLF